MKSNNVASQYTVRFGNVVAHEGASEREALDWYQVLVNAAHTYGRRLELRCDGVVSAFISAVPAQQLAEVA